MDNGLCLWTDTFYLFDKITSFKCNLVWFINAVIYIFLKSKVSKNKTDISKTLVVLSDIGIFTSGIFIKIIMGHLNT